MLNRRKLISRVRISDFFSERKKSYFAQTYSIMAKFSIFYLLPTKRIVVEILRIAVLRHWPMEIVHNLNIDRTSVCTHYDGYTTMWSFQSLKYTFGYRKGRRILNSAARFA